MIVIAKFKDTIVQIVKVQEFVMFSKDTGWICICIDFYKPMRKRDQIKWVKSSETRFEWVKEFAGE